jgi:hypothetical protein
LDRIVPSSRKCGVVAAVGSVGSAAVAAGFVAAGSVDSAAAGSEGSVVVEWPSGVAASVVAASAA